MTGMPPRDLRRPQRLQMADLARLAGVSVATVSRALNGSTEVSLETRERIGALARSLNYSINLGAKNLRLRQSRTVAVVVTDDPAARQHVSDPFFLAMLGSLAEALADRGFDLLLSRVDAGEFDAAARLYDSGVAIGIVLIGPSRHHEQLNRMASRQVPLVVWGAQLPQQTYCSVGGDNIAGGELATRHLLESGRRRIVFVGDAQGPEVAMRLKGFRRALLAAGIDPDPALTIEAAGDAAQARRGIEALCASGTGFDAVFACSDVLAMAAIRALRHGGVNVPDAVAIVGYDDIEWASHADPPLTSVRQPIVEAGAEIVDALLAIVDGRSAPARTLPVSLVARASTTPRRPLLRPIAAPSA